MGKPFTPLHSWNEFHEAENELRKANRKQGIDGKPFTEMDSVIEAQVADWIEKHRP